MAYCKHHLKKEQKINELEGEIVSLEAQLHYQERRAKEGLFGSSIPSWKLPIKPNRSTKQPRNRGNPTTRGTADRVLANMMLTQIFEGS